MKQLFLTSCKDVLNLRGCSSVSLLIFCWRTALKLVINKQKVVTRGFLIQSYHFASPRHCLQKLLLALSQVPSPKSQNLKSDPNQSSSTSIMSLPKVSALSLLRLLMYARIPSMNPSSLMEATFLMQRVTLSALSAEIFFSMAYPSSWIHL